MIPIAACLSGMSGSVIVASRLAVNRAAKSTWRDVDPNDASHHFFLASDLDEDGRPAHSGPAFTGSCDDVRIVRVSEHSRR